MNEQTGKYNVNIKTACNNDACDGKACSCGNRSCGNGSCGSADKGKTYYKCSVCGFLHDGSEGAPKYCRKCDNDKFYKCNA